MAFQKQKIEPHRKSFLENFLQPDDTHMEASLLQSAVWSILFLNLSVIISIALVYFLNETNSVIYIGSYFLMCLVTFAVGIYQVKSRLGFGVGIIAALLCWLLMGMIYFVSNEYLYFYHWKYSMVKNISVNEVTKHPDASAFYFNEGKVLLDKHSSSYFITGDSETGSGSVTSYLVPFVSNDWKETDSVYVLLFGEENNQYEYIVPLKYSDFYNELQKPYNAGMVLRVPDGADLYEDKVNKAKQELNLKISTHPIILKWVKDPEQYVNEYFMELFKILLYANIAWLIFIILRRAYFAYRRSGKSYVILQDNDD